VHELQLTRSQTSTINQPARVPRSRDWLDIHGIPQPLHTATGPEMVMFDTRLSMGVNVNRQILYYRHYIHLSYSLLDKVNDVGGR
jgi:hypothetical protein